MGFWHTGYLEFHEPTGEGPDAHVQPKPPTFSCTKCRVEFSTERDLRVHSFEGHTIQRPVLVFKGRECGRSRLTITTETSVEDWAIRNADSVTINGVATSVASAVETLSSQRSGIFDVSLTSTDAVHTSQFEFAFADENDLEGVDAALERFIYGAELSLRAIDDFIMRSKRYRTAGRYLSGLANYLYGVLAREGIPESGVRGHLRDGGGYEGKYDQAVGILGAFDRPPAEAICGMVAFHYNQFQRAMTKTKSQRVAEVSLRFRSLLTSEPWRPEDLSQSPHSSLDFALSDSVLEQVLAWSALPLDGTAVGGIGDLTSQIDAQLPRDAFKLHLVAAEHAVAAGDLASAGHHAERLRHSGEAETWYTDFRHRLQSQGVSQP
jgi:hypothetical protein